MMIIDCHNGLLTEQKCEVIKLCQNRVNTPHPADPAVDAACAKAFADWEKLQAEREAARQKANDLIIKGAQ